MPHRLLTTLKAVSFVVALTFSASSASARALEGFSDLAEELLPSVVNVSTTQQVSERRPPQEAIPNLPPGSPFEDIFRDYFNNGSPEQRAKRATSLGSGFIIDASGIIVTNNHVIDDAEKVTVILNDKTELPATVLGSDSKTDLAILRVKPDKPLKAIRWGDSDKARVGDWIVAIGNPFGLSGSVTAGIISARARDINAGPYDEFIQTDAAINRGNSGGPMFNENGELIGINTAIYSPTGGSVGIGFAIPANLARPVIAQLQQYGKAKRGWLGVQIQPVTKEIADSFALPNTKGALVSLVNKNSPAEKAGLKEGDVVLSFDGQPIEEMKILPRTVANTSIGKKAPIRFWRGGKILEGSIVVGELDSAAQKASEGESDKKAANIAANAVYFFGMRLTGISEELRTQYEMPDDLQGVLLLDVSPSSEVAEKGLKAGDVILQVNQQTVKTGEDVRTLLQNAVKAGKKTALLRVVTQEGDRLFVAVSLPPRFGERDG
jgi:serine protease Do